MKKLFSVIALVFLFCGAFCFAKERVVKISVGGVELEGVIYDTDLAEEIAAKFPLSVSMVGFGGREYYGAIPFTPKNADGGQLRFDDGDITYCATNNTLAIFYAQTDRPHLTMRVIPIGRLVQFENARRRNFARKINCGRVLVLRGIPQFRDVNFRRA